jgi:hypothetical protein
MAGNFFAASGGPQGSLGGKGKLLGWEAIFFFWWGWKGDVDFSWEVFFGNFYVLFLANYKNVYVKNLVFEEIKKIYEKK